MSFERVISRNGEGRADLSRPLTLDEWLTSLMEERAVLIMRLRQIEKPLVQHGKIKSESISRRRR